MRTHSGFGTVRTEPFIEQLLVLAFYQQGVVGGESNRHVIWEDIREITATGQ